MIYLIQGDLGSDPHVYDEATYTDKYYVTEDPDAAFEAGKNGKLLFGGENYTDVVSQLEAHYPAPKFLTYVRQGYYGNKYDRNIFINKIPILECGFDVLSPNRLTEIINQFDTCWVSTNDWNKFIESRWWTDGHEDFYVRDLKHGPFYYQAISYSPSKAKAKRNRPASNKIGKYRRGKMPVAWFNTFSYRIEYLLEFNMRMNRNLGTWDNVESNFPSVVKTLKKLNLLTYLRDEPRYLEMIEEASHYVIGAKQHRTEEWVEEWCDYIEQECDVLDLPIKCYDKKKKKGNSCQTSPTN